MNSAAKSALRAKKCYARAKITPMKTLETARSSQRPRQARRHAINRRHASPQEPPAPRAAPVLEMLPLVKTDGRGMGWR
jgi:hypothetical protein